MKIQVNSDHHIVGHEGLTQHVEETVSAALTHVRGTVTRVEVHLNDENGEKSGAADKRCMMEARVAGLNPIVVTDHADNLHQAISHASSKLVKAVDHAIGKVRSQRPRRTGLADASAGILAAGDAAQADDLAADGHDHDLNSLDAHDDAPAQAHAPHAASRKLQS